MSTIRTMEARMPPGFRFHPRDSELVLDYLLQKLTTGGGGDVAMVDVDLNNCEPWELPEESRVGGNQNEWYFFSLRGRKYATGDRTDRATRSGYWKATGKDRAIAAAAAAAVVVGMRKTLVFYRGRAPRGTKTEWVMHEFRLLQPQLLLPTSKEDWVLCRVFLKSKSKGGTTTTTAPPPSRLQAYGIPPDQPAADPAVANCCAFDSSPIPAEQVPCFSGWPPPTLAFRRPPVSLLDDNLLAVGDTSEKQEEAMVGSVMTGTATSGLELAPAWKEQENYQLVQMWNPLYW